MTKECLRLTDDELSSVGKQRIEWAWRKMPVLQRIWKEWEQSQPLKGVKIAACLHISAKTANLARVLQVGGADLVLCASNPLSTQDDIAAALNVAYGIPTYARRGVDNDSYYSQINAALDIRPDLTIDDGADLVTILHQERPEQTKRVIGGTEETTTGVVRLKAMKRAGELKYPTVAVNDALTKHLFDNRYGTGQSTIDGLLRATNYLIAGTDFVVVGYGWCGRGLASRAKGLGARVTVVEIDPFKALEAIMEGYEVATMKEAAKRADFIVTVTGNIHVLGEQHIPFLKDGVILANAGHFNVGTISATADIFLSTSRMYGSSRSASIFSPSVTI